MLRHKKRTICVFVMMVLFGSPAAALDIDWRLQDAHRLFVDGRPFRDPALKWAPGERARDFLLRALKVESLPSDPDLRPSRRGIFNFEPGMTHWSSSDQSYSKQYLKPPHGFFKGKLQIRLADSGLANEHCTWRVLGMAGEFVTFQRCGDYTVEALPVALNTPSGKPTEPTKILVSTSSGKVDEFTVHPRHYIVLGLGDSYSSAEGSPDRPAKWADREEPRNFDWLLKPYPDYLKAPSEWWDRTCHRSLYSWQSLAATRLVAALQGQAAVSYLSFACSGDEIFDGLLYARIDPIHGGVELPLDVRDGIWLQQPNNVVGDFARQMRRSQLNHSIEVLCQDGLGGHSVVMAAERLVAVRQCGRFLKPDFVFLGIGGNDVKFADVVRGLVVPRKGRDSSFWIKRIINQWMVDFVRHQAGVMDHADAIYEVGKLPGKYEAVSKILNDLWSLSSEGRRVIFSRYPNPMPSEIPKGLAKKYIEETGVTCKKDRKDENASILQCRTDYHWYSTAISIRETSLNLLEGWVAEFDRDELREVEELQGRLSEAVKSVCRDDWRCITPDSVSKSGINFYWHNDVKGASEFAMNEPTFLHDKHHIIPEPGRRLSGWDAFVHPYLNRRLVLTSNDSVFTLGSTRDCREGKGYCLNLRESLTGTSHMTLFGHADAADKAFSQMCELLAQEHSAFMAQACM